MPLPIVAAVAAEVGRVHEDGVDHQRSVVVVIGDEEPDAVFARDDVAAGHVLWLLLSVAGLVRAWRVEAQFAAGREQHQAAVGVDARLADAVKRQGDDARIGSGREGEVVFELALRAVVGQVDAAIDAAKAGAGVERDGVAPAGRIVADKIVHGAGNRLHRHGRGEWIPAQQRHAHHIGRRRGLVAAEFGRKRSALGLAQREHRLGGG